MSGSGKDLDPLVVRKQALLIESELHRFEMAHAYRNLSAASRPASRVVGVAGKMSPWLLLGGTAVGLFVARRVGRVGGALRTAMRLAEWAPSLFSLWKKRVPARRGVADPFDPESIA